MTSAYAELYFGLAGAIVLVYLIIVVNFQSWLDPFIIITALPAAIAGIVWMLFVTGTTLSIPALNGAIMCMGIASVLLVGFGRERLEQGYDSIAAAIDAGFTRFRPLLMTAGAMILGMVPMALSIGEGGEQNAPLGRAVIGGDRNIVRRSCRLQRVAPEGSHHAAGRRYFSRVISVAARLIEDNNA
jgi:multidrug efflux pump subunit AcrB